VGPRERRQRRRQGLDLIGWLIRRVLRLAMLLVSLPRLLVGGLLDLLARRDALVLRFTREVPDHHAGWRRFFAAQHVLSLEEALEAIAHARVKLIIVLLDRAELAVTQAEELVVALDGARARGITSLVWIDGTTAPCLLASCAADRSLTTPEATLEFQGLRVRSVFLAELLELVGVVPEMDREGAYKTMADMFDHRSMSPAHREMMTDIGGDLHDQFVSALVTGRGLDRARVVAALDDAPVSHRAAVAQRLFDGLAYRDEVEERGKALLGLERDLRTIGPAQALRRRRRRELVRDAFRDRPVIAVLPLVGAIIPGETGRGLPAHAAVDLLEGLREAHVVRAVVLRIDSPGGSATASDDLWRAIKRLDQEKPVIASLGRVAASGGYYAAVGARRIVSHATTLTGSIGIVAGKLTIAPLLERAGIRIEGPSFGARAGMYDPDRRFTEDEKRAARRELERFYRVFLERVAEGRKMAMFDVEKLAQGRVYTGRRALGLNLVDEVGTFDVALTRAREAAGITGPHRLARVQLPKGWATSLTSERAYVSQLLDLAALSRERALAWCPIEVDGL
jgi:protease IV